MNTMFWHLTPNGKRETVYYWFRRRFVKPVPDRERCYMGGPVDPMVHCPRAAGDDGFCARHSVNKPFWSAGVRSGSSRPEKEK